MKDSFGREISYLRVSITERCNLNCIYCGKDDCAKKDTELSAEQICSLVRAFARCGIKKVRITGGEPLVRSDVCDIVAGIAGIDGIETVALTTNGVYLAQYAQALKDAGLQSVNISLDSTDDSTYRHLTGADVLDKVLKGIRLAKAAGLSPIKINAVLMKGVNSDGAGELIALTKESDLDVRFIELMPFSESGEDSALLVSGEEILAAFPALKPIESETATARYYRMEGYRGRVGLINARSQKFCADCNRLRLLGNGKVKPCLGDAALYDLMPYIDDRTRLMEAIRDIILQKPAGHHFESQAAAHGLNKIGG